eukprot:4369571-Prymnesium_polylepis.1
MHMRNHQDHARGTRARATCSLASGWPRRGHAPCGGGQGECAHFARATTATHAPHRLFPRTVPHPTPPPSARTSRSRPPLPRLVRMRGSYAPKAAGEERAPVPLSAPRSITEEFVGPCDGLLPQPATYYRYKLALIEYNIPGHASGVGGYDKGKNGHRVDSIPIANGVIKAGSMCFPIKYLPEKHDKFAEICKCFDGLIVRINPGQLEGEQQT